MSKIFEKLLNVQTALKAPKGQYNSFGKYNYRSCEDILEAVKPLLKTEKLALTISDEVVYKEGRYYIKATATIADTEETGVISVEGWAREEESKKGMDGSQVTGASSSYARKYALNGLFAIDDNKDSDTTNDDKSTKAKTKKTTTTDVDERLKNAQDSISKLCGELNETHHDEIMTILKEYTTNGNPNAIKDLNKAKECYRKINALKK